MSSLIQTPLTYKGLPTPAFQVPVAQASSSSTIVDLRSYNAVHVDAYMNASSASFDIIIEGSNSQSGVFITMPDPNAVKTGVTSNTTFNVLAGAAFVRARVTNVSGTFAVGQGIQIYLTPYVAAGNTNVNISNVANQNLSQVNGSAFSLGQALASASLPVVVAGTGTATTTAIPVAVATTTLLAANSARRGATIYNDSSSHSHVKLGSGATGSDFTVVLQAVTVNVGGYYEVPAGYTGIVTAYGTTAAGNWRVTELT